MAGLSANAGALDIRNGASATISGALANTGSLFVDVGGSGGSVLTIGGVLSNTGSVTIGGGGLSLPATVNAGGLVDNGRIILNGASQEATLNVSGAAPAVLSGDLELSGSALVEFASGSITSIGGGGSAVISGTSAFIADTGALTQNGALAGLTRNGGLLALSAGAAVSVTGSLVNAGRIALDSGGPGGGTTLTIGGVLSNTGSVTIGNTNTLSAPDSISVHGLAGTGTISLFGGYDGGLFLGNANGATLDVLSAAPAVLSGGLQLAGSALVEFASGSIGSVGNQGFILLDGPAAFVADSAAPTQDGALAGLSGNAGSVTLSDGASLGIVGNLVNTGVLYVDNGGGGGSTLRIGGVLNNSGALQLGQNGGGPGAPTTVSVGSLIDTGSALLYGNNGQQATLDIVSGAAPTVLTGDLEVHGSALVEFASGSILSVGASGTVVIDGPNAFIADAGSVTQQGALAGLIRNGGTLSLLSGVSFGITGGLANAGTIQVDAPFAGGGGTTLAIGGVLSNTGSVTIGTSNTLSAPDSLSAGGFTGTGTVTLFGGFQGGVPLASTIGATLDILSAAPSVLSGSLNLIGSAVVEFASGSISSIARTGAIVLDGPAAFVADAGAPAQNGALAALSGNAGTIDLRDGASLAIVGSLANTGTIVVDSQGTAGGSTLTISGVLSNTGGVTVGNRNSPVGPSTLTVGGLVDSGTILLFGSNGQQATLDVLSGAAPTVLNGDLEVHGSAVVEFASGSIISIGPAGSVVLDGPQAFIADAGSPTQNGALSGLVRNAGTLEFDNGASLVLAGALVNANTLSVGGSGNGGTLTVGGVLSNTSQVTIGNSSTLAGPATISAAGLTGAGIVRLFGGYQGGTFLGNTNQATLDITAAAPSALSGSLDLFGSAVVEYASGSIGSIATGGIVLLDGPAAFIADAAAPAQNGALAGLSANSGTLDLRDGASVAIGGNLVNTSALAVDSQGNGGSELTIGGVLSNTGSVTIGIPNGSPNAPSILSAGGLVNSGSVQLFGSAGQQAALDVLSAAPAVLTGRTELHGSAVLEFASGSISSIGQAASLLLDGPAAFVADAGAPTQNGALAALAENDGTLNLQDGAALTLAGLSNSGTVDVDSSGTGGSTLTVAGTLTNAGSLQVGANNSSAGPTTVTIGRLIDSGSISLVGSAQQATLVILSGGTEGADGDDSITLSGELGARCRKPADLERRRGDDQLRFHDERRGRRRRRVGHDPKRRYRDKHGHR